ncbi:hypothetical protein CCS38_23340, partial [Streptomyces purpurogeneiscleroticus]|nr:hypothetical protein [Streptomyces purpurogeneiscleroticus]
MCPDPTEHRSKEWEHLYGIDAARPHLSDMIPTMGREKGIFRGTFIAGHLLAVAVVGACVAMLLGGTLLVAAWNSGLGVLGVAALAVEALLGTAALAVVGRRGRRLLPWASGSPRGHLLWAAAVLLLGTAGAAAVLYLLMTPYGMAGTTTWQLLLLTGPPYAIAAALLVPRLALRIAALAAAALVGLTAALLSYADTTATEAALAHPAPP